MQSLYSVGIPLYTFNWHVTKIDERTTMDPGGVYPGDRTERIKYRKEKKKRKDEKPYTNVRNPNPKAWHNYVTTTCPQKLITRRLPISQTKHYVHFGKTTVWRKEKRSWNLKKKRLAKFWSLILFPTLKKTTDHE